MAPKHDFLLPQPISIGWGSKKLCLGAKKRLFAKFYFLKLNFHVKNQPTLPQNRQFSIFDKSADMADINDRQVI